MMSYTSRLAKHSIGGTPVIPMASFARSGTGPTSVSRQYAGRGGVGRIIWNSVLDPLAPTRRANVDPLLRFGIRPAAENLTAWEDQRMWLVLIDHGEFKTTIKRRGRNRLPHLIFVRP
jgi:hypothetical protein